jgi:TatD DNase family protein
VTASWTDSHCHLQLGARAADVEAADAQVRRAVEAGVTRIVCVGTDLETSRRAIDLASRHREVFATVGLHPHEASKLGAEWAQLEALAHDDRVVGIGEAGFDLYYEHSPRDEQETAFRFQIRLAKRLDRALVIHSRDAWDDTFRVLTDEGTPARTVFHCFTGGPAEAERALATGASLSFSGIVSFADADDVRAAAATVPADRLLVETDAPVLAPVPHRGQENEPAFVTHVGAALAAARGEPVERVAACTADNATRAFALGDHAGEPWTP